MCDLFIVLGMHRSGTSLTTKAIESCGVSLSDNLMSASPDNKKGYFEDSDIVLINEKLLRNNNSYWFSSSVSLKKDDYYYQVKDEAIELIKSKIKGKSSLVFKDPRFSLTLDFWSDIFSTLNLKVKYILSTRNITSTIDSLNKRDLFNREFSAYISSRHIYFCLSFLFEKVKDCDWISVSYESILESPENEIDRLSEFTGYSDPKKKVAFTNVFLDSSLNNANLWDVDDTKKLYLDDLFFSCPIDGNNISDSIFRYKKCWKSLYESNKSFIDDYEAILNEKFRFEYDAAHLSDIAHLMKVDKVRFEERNIILESELLEEREHFFNKINALKCSVDELEKNNSELRLTIENNKRISERLLEMLKSKGLTFSNVKLGLNIVNNVRKNNGIIWLIRNSELNLDNMKVKLQMWNNDLHNISNGDVYKHNYNLGRSVSLTPVPLKNDIEEPLFKQKLIAYYLPQFHPFPENDEWWGKGFTEWTNVTKAQPQFLGHHQPRLPADLGFYDLRLKDTIAQQCELAKSYGLHGFCFHLYWFSGQRLMERPLDIFLENKDIDFNFSICWANENWTRRWDGDESDVLIGQEHSFETDKNFIKDMKKYLVDDRYIKLDGKKIITIYRPSIIPNIKELIAYWREYCLSEPEIGDVMFIMAKSFDQKDPYEFGFDIAVEFPPHQLHTNISPIHPGNYLNQDFQGVVYSYGDVVDFKVSDYSSDKDNSYIPTVFPSWDNEARKPGRGNIFHASTPTKYQEWLEAALVKGSKVINGETVAFVNAWNEWAEGAYLEPDRKFGHAYLESTYYSLSRDSLKTRVKETQEKFSSSSNKLVILHLHYIELFEEISSNIDNIDSFDLMISIGYKVKSSDIERILDKYPNAALFLFDNRGRDIKPFFEVVEFASSFGYEYLLKVHSKKSLHRVDGDTWRQGLIHSLCGSESIVKDNLASLSSASLIAPRSHLFKNRDYIGSNMHHLETILGADSAASNYRFPAGSMYWAKFDTIVQLSNSIKSWNADYEPEHGQVDGTLAHAIERYTGYFIEKGINSVMKESKH